MNGAAGLTPVEYLGGMYVKRDDLYRPMACSGGRKLQCTEEVLGAIQAQGLTTAVFAGALQSPQHARVAQVAKELGMASVHVIGTTKERAVRSHPAIAAAVGLGGTVVSAKAAYQNVLMATARRYCNATPGAAAVPFGADLGGLSGVSPKQVLAFHEAGAAQVANLPDELELLVMPTGSGVTAASVLYGLAKYRPDLRPVVNLVFLGSNRWDWIANRLEGLGINPYRLPIDITELARHVPYTREVHYDFEGVPLHPIYEAKVVRHMDEMLPAGWRTPAAMLWLVGGPLRALG